MKKVVLGYSGGLDTSVLIKLIREKYHADVITLTVDIGQHEDVEVVKQKALYIGACEAHVIDARDEFCKEYVLPTLKANAVYENAYPLATALGRPLIAKYLVALAQKCNADCIAHGCTGKGNDQVRLESAITLLDPSIPIWAPIREYSLSRDYEIAYAKQHTIPVSEQVNIYSIDENLWGRSVECGTLEDENCEPPDDVFHWTASPKNAPDDSSLIEIEFDAGKPVALNNEPMELRQLITTLNREGGKHGIGRVDHIESRLVGIKSREVYEAPAATILIRAHQDLEKLVLPKDVLHFKPIIESTFAELVYNGLWFSPLRHALSSFIEETQKHITGHVRAKLYKGLAQIVGRSSKNSLYVKNLATYEGSDEFDSSAAKGFIDIWSLPYRVYSTVHQSQSTADTVCKEKQHACDMAKKIC